jgi:hypothetical protein
MAGVVKDVGIKSALRGFAWNFTVPTAELAQDVK